MSSGIAPDAPVWPGSESVLLQALSDALKVPASWLLLEPQSSADWRRPPHRGSRHRVWVRGELRYSVRWLEADNPVLTPLLFEASRLFARGTGLPVPAFITRAESPGAVGIVEEWIPSQGSAREMAAASQNGARAAASLLSDCLRRMLVSPALSSCVGETDRDVCLRALHWLPPRLAGRVRAWLLGPHSPLGPATLLLHQDLLLSNLLVGESGQLVAVVDFEHCVPSSMPWYALWRISWFEPEMASVLCGPLALPESELLRPLCIALELDRQFAVLQFPRFLHDWKTGWKPALLQACAKEPGARDFFDSLPKVSSS